MKNDTKALIVIGGLGAAAWIFRDKITEAINSLTQGADSAGGYGGDAGGAGAFSSNYPGADLMNYPTTQGTGYPWNQAYVDWPPENTGTDETRGALDSGNTGSGDQGGSTDGGYSPYNAPQGEKKGSLWDNPLVQIPLWIGGSYALEKGGKAAYDAIKNRFGKTSESNLKKVESKAKFEEAPGKRTAAEIESKAAMEGRTARQLEAERMAANKKVNFNTRATQAEINAARTESKAGNAMLNEGRALATEGKVAGKLAEAGKVLGPVGKIVGGVLALIGLGTAAYDIGKETKESGSFGYGFLKGAENTFKGLSGISIAEYNLEKSAEAMAQQQQIMQQSLQKYQNSPQVQAQLQQAIRSSSSGGSNKSSAPVQTQQTPTRTTQTITTKAAPYAVASAANGGTIMSDGSTVYASFNTSSNNVRAPTQTASPAVSSPATVNGVKPAGYNTNTPGQVGQYVTSTGGRSTAPTMKLSDYRSSSSSSSSKKK